MQKSPDISIVIPAFNEEKCIKKCLEALSSQSTSIPFEVILVDNNSTDKTVSLAKKFKKKLNLLIVSEKTKGRSPARKAGFDHANGKIIFSTDADTHVPKDWIDSLISHFENEKIVGVSGSCYINNCSYWTNTSFNILQPILMHAYRLFTGHYWLSGFNFAIQKEIYIKSGGFNPTLNAQEDTDLAMRVSKLGEIKFIKHPAVLFDGRRFKDGLFRGLYPYIQSYVSCFILKNQKNTYLNDVR